MVHVVIPGRKGEEMRVTWQSCMRHVGIPKYNNGLSDYISDKGHGVGEVVKGREKVML